jgi:PadR family transcriptional regulator PadR
MPNRDLLGQNELMVMLAILHSGNNAYGVPIGAQISERTGHEMLQGSIYAILERLEDRGLVVSRMGEATAQRGGRAKRFFELTAEGVRQVREARRVLNSLWEGLPKIVGGRS